MVDFAVIIDIQGMQRWHTDVEAKNSSEALHKAWAEWAEDPSIAHPQRIRAEHTGDMEIFITRIRT